MNELEKTIYNIEKYVLYLVLALFPIVMLPISPNIFIVPKIVFLGAGVLLLITLWATRMIVAGKIEYHRGSYDIPVILIALAYFASTIFSNGNKMDALLLPGTTSLVVASAILYFLINQHQEKLKEGIGIAFLLSGVLFSLVSLASVLGLFSNPGGLAGYVPTDKASPDVGYVAPALYLLCLAIYGVYAFRTYKSSILKTASLVLTSLVITGLALCLWQVIPGKPFAHKMPSYGISWAVAIDSLKVSPIWGVGPGNYINAFTRFKPLEYNTTDIWNLRYQSASSQYLSIITETGIVGILAFIILILFVYKNFKSKEKETDQKLFSKTLSVVILLSLFVFFPASTITFYALFVLLALASSVKKMGIALVAKGENEELTIGSAFSRIPAVILTLPFFAFVFWIAYKGIPIVQAERYFAQSLEARKENKVQETLELLNKAVTANRYVDRYHIVSAQLNLILANAIINNARNQSGGQITEEQRSAISNLIQLSIQAAKNAVALNPQRAGNWELLAGVYRSIIGVAEGADNFAAQSYRQAINLDRFNPVTWVLYGGVFYAKGDFDNAIKIFETAVSLKQDYANARFNLAYAYAQKKNYDAAIDQMTRVVSLVKKDTQDYEVALKALNDFKSQKSASVQPTEELTPPVKAEPINPPVDLPDNSAPPETNTDYEEINTNRGNIRNTNTPTQTPSPAPNNG